MYLRDAAFGPGSGSIIGDIYCAGTEGRLIDCDILDFPWCTHNSDISVRCCKYTYNDYIDCGGNRNLAI